jgi:hypothetical protein
MGAPLRILLAAATGPVADRLAELLAGEAQVEVCKTGAELEAALWRHPYGAVVLEAGADDAALPAAIALRERFPALPVVALASGHVDPQWFELAQAVLPDPLADPMAVVFHILTLAWRYARSSAG